MKNQLLYFSIFFILFFGCDFTNEPIYNGRFPEFMGGINKKIFINFEIYSGFPNSVDVYDLSTGSHSLLDSGCLFSTAVGDWVSTINSTQNPYYWNIPYYTSIYALNIKTRKKILIDSCYHDSTNRNIYLNNPVFRPDGNSIIYRKDSLPIGKYEHTEYIVKDISGNIITNVRFNDNLSNFRNSSNIYISNKGNKIAFINNDSEIMLVDLTGKDFTLLYKFEFDGKGWEDSDIDFNLNWSRDDSKIYVQFDAYFYNEKGPSEMGFAEIKADGSGYRKILKKPREEGQIFFGELIETDTKILYTETEPINEYENWAYVKVLDLTNGNIKEILKFKNLFGVTQAQYVDENHIMICNYDEILFYNVKDKTVSSIKLDYWLWRKTGRVFVSH